MALLPTKKATQAEITSAVATNKKNKTTTIIVGVVLACVVAFLIYKYKK